MRSYDTEGQTLDRAIVADGKKDPGLMGYRTGNFSKRNKIIDRPREEENGQIRLITGRSTLRQRALEHFTLVYRQQGRCSRPRLIEVLENLRKRFHR